MKTNLEIVSNLNSIQFTLHTNKYHKSLDKYDTMIHHICIMNIRGINKFCLK